MPTPNSVSLPRSILKSLGRITHWKLSGKLCANALLPAKINLSHSRALCLSESDQNLWVGKLVIRAAGPNIVRSCFVACLLMIESPRFLDSSPGSKMHQSVNMFSLLELPPTTQRVFHESHGLSPTPSTFTCRADTDHPRMI